MDNERFKLQYILINNDIVIEGVKDTVTNEILFDYYDFYKKLNEIIKIG